MKFVADLSIHQAAKIAGIGLVIMFLIAISGMLFTSSELSVPGDRFSTISQVIIYACDVVVALGLFVLLKPVNKNLSLSAAILRFIYTALAFVFLFIKTYSYGLSIASTFFIPHLFIIGYLVYKSGFIPKILGVLLIIASFSSLIVSYGHFLLPVDWYFTITPILFLLAVPAEISLGIWLLVKGSKIPEIKNEGMI